MNRRIRFILAAGAAVLGTAYSVSLAPRVVNDVNSTVVLAKGILWTGSSPSF